MKKLIIILIIFSSCGTTKEITKEVKRDSTRVHIKRVVTPQLLNTITFEEVCDSVGNLNIIGYKYVQGKTKTILRTVNNTITLEVDTDSIVNEKIKEFKSTYQSKDKVVIKYKTPSWVYKSLILNLLLLAFIFRKFIPLLKMIP